MAKPVKFGSSKSKAKSGSTAFDFGHNIAPRKSKGGKSGKSRDRKGGGS
jgi:hypothetical protein